MFANTLANPACHSNLREKASLKARVEYSIGKVHSVYIQLLFTQGNKVELSVNKARSQILFTRKRPLVFLFVWAKRVEAVLLKISCRLSIRLLESLSDTGVCVPIHVKWSEFGNGNRKKGGKKAAMTRTYICLKNHLRYTKRKKSVCYVCRSEWSHCV